MIYVILFDIVAINLILWWIVSLAIGWYDGLIVLLKSWLVAFIPITIVFINLMAFS